MADPPTISLIDVAELGAEDKLAVMSAVKQGRVCPFDLLALPIILSYNIYWFRGFP